MKTNIITFLIFWLSSTCIAAQLSITDFGATADDYSDDDSIAINAAITSAGEGDTVVIPEGTFHIRNIIRLRSNIRLAGSGFTDSTITALYEGDGTYDLLIYGNGVSDVTISGLRLKSNYSGGLKALVYIKNSTSVTVRDSSFHRFKRWGVYFNNTVDGEVINTRFQDATEIDTGGYGYGVVFTNGCVRGRVEDSAFYGPDIRHGVVVQGNAERTRPSHHVVITKNYFTDTAQDAIDLHGQGEHSNYVTYNVIDGDPASTASGRGIGVGEAVDDHGPSGPGNVIMHNTIRGTRYGVHVLAGSPDVIIKYNRIYDCRRKGIYIEEGIGAVIRGNTIQGCKSWGIHIKDGDNTLIRNADEYLNQVNYNGWGGSTFGGVRVDAGNTGLDIQNNDFCNNDDNGGPNLSFDGQGVVQNNMCAW